MARFNVDDSIFKEMGFQDLMIYTKNRHTAKGVVWELIELAQKYWVPEMKPIPMEVFEAHGLPEILYAKGGLAKIENDGVYVRGSRERFAWLFDKIEAGKAGGAASVQAKASRRKHNQAAVSTIKHDQARSSKIKPPTPTLSSSSSSNLNTITPAALFDFESIKNKYPKPSGSNAEKRFREQVKTQEDFEKLTLALTHYLAMLALPENDWRRPKQTLEAFLGTKSSGYFWRDYIDPGSARPAKMKGPKAITYPEFKPDPSPREEVTPERADQIKRELKEKFNVTGNFGKTGTGENT